MGNGGRRRTRSRGTGRRSLPSTLIFMAGRPDVPPRTLTASEADALEFMLSVADARIEPLRRQAEFAAVNWECTCGCATVHFVIDRSRASAAKGLCSPVLDAYRRGPVDLDRFCELIVFLDDGWLSSLELVWYGAMPIVEFPPPTEFEPPVLRC